MNKLKELGAWEIIIPSPSTGCEIRLTYNPVIARNPYWVKYRYNDSCFKSLTDALQFMESLIP